MKKHLVRLLAVLCLFPGGLPGMVITVPDDYSSIQAALNGAPDNAVIQVRAGTYREFIQALDLNKHLYIKSLDGPGAAVITGEDTRSLLRIENGPGGDAGKRLVFDGFIFEHGRETAGQAASPIVLANTKSAFIHCEFRDNHCFDRAGAVLIYGAQSSPVFTDCTFLRNSSDRLAGAVLVNGDQCLATFNRCTFIENTSRTPLGTDWNHGGAIYVASANVRIFESMFRGNSARYAGGAIMLLNDWNEPESFAEIINSRFYENFCSKEDAFTPPPTEGGAIMAENNLHVLVDRCVFFGNIAEAGGAIHTYRAHLTVRNAVITNNTANGRNGLGYGGGIGINTNDDGDSQRRPASISVNNTLIKDCSAPVGGALYASGNITYNVPVSIQASNVTFSTCRAVTNHQSLGVGGGAFLSLSEVDFVGVNMINNWCDWVGGALAIVQNTGLSMRDSRIIGNAGWAQGDIHNPDNLIISQENVLWAFNPAGGGEFTGLYAIPPMAVADTAYLTALHAPAGAGVTIQPGNVLLEDRGGYSAEVVNLENINGSVEYTLDGGSSTAKIEVDYDAGKTVYSFNGNTPQIPARIEAEHYDAGGSGYAYLDADDANLGDGIRAGEGVDILSGNDSDGAGYVGFTQPGEWLSYTVGKGSSTDVSITIRYATPSGATLALQLDGEPWASSLTLPATTGWGDWKTAQMSGLTLSEPIQRLRVLFLSGSANLDWMEINHHTSAPPLELFPDADNLGGGWYWNDWLGFFNADNLPWIFHFEHGWFYVTGTADSLFFWMMQQIGWIWTSPTQYPYLYHFSTTGWWFYNKPSVNPRWFLQLEYETWVDYD